MKKIMMMMAVVALAMATNAASVTWQVTATKAPVGGLTGDPTFSANALNGGIAYLFVGAQNTAALVTSINEGTFTGAGNLWSQATTSSGAIAKATLGSFSNQDVTLYMVIFDKGTIGGSGFYMISTDVTQHFVNSNLTYQYNTANGRLPGVWTAVVPEPTSMALLALGAAVLGLRRKNRK